MRISDWSSDVCSSDLPIEFAMNTAHEFVKVNAGLAAHGHRQVERIHQKAFPATHPAPHVYAARHIGTPEDFFQGSRPRPLEYDPIVVVLLQTLYGGELSLVGPIIALDQHFIVILADIHKHQIDRKSTRLNSSH